MQKLPEKWEKKVKVKFKTKVKNLLKLLEKKKTKIDNHCIKHNWEWLKTQDYINKRIPKKL